MNKSANMSNIKNKSKSVHGIGQDSDSRFEDIYKRPRRAPITRRVMKRDFPATQQNLPTNRQQEIPTEDCYTCGFRLNWHSQEEGEKVVRCKTCNEVDIHESCQRACRRCEELDELL